MKKVMILLGLVALSILWFYTPDDYERPPHVAEGERVLNAATGKLWTLGFELTANGGGMMHDVNMLGFFMSTQSHMTIEDARSVTVAATEVVLKLVNEDAEVRPYLSQFPFQSNNVEFVINFKGNNPAARPGVQRVITKEGDIIFVFHDKEIPSVREPYPDALAKVGPKDWEALLRGALFPQDQASSSR